MLADSAPELHRTGEGASIRSTVGSLACTGCGYAVAATAVVDSLPACPACGGTSFRRRSIFEHPTVDASAISAHHAESAWLDRARAETEGSAALAFEIAGAREVHELAVGWTRIGRSATADIQLDDPTVSRRHALIVRTATEGLRALDDRSLNGLFVNGERVEWARLTDGDELEIGRYRLYVVTG